MSAVFKASLLLATFFGINKLVALLRQTLIARQFGFSSEIDAFNVANNLPDLVFSLLAGGTLTLAFIPIFSEYLLRFDKEVTWRLFSKIANILFLVTSVLAAIFAIFARDVVGWQFGISPGFSPSLQNLVVELMRINLLAILIFSLSGLVMATLQAHKHFLLPALSPILYNFGLIIGTLIFAPNTGVQIGTFRLPALGLGIHGLVYGTVLGALLHLGIQIPGIIKYKFRWSLSFDFRDPGVWKVFRLAGPRILTVFLIQVIFLSRDNLASRLPEGSVTALTYGYFILQVPETLIGSAVATALLPTLSEYASQQKLADFAQAINRSLTAIIASTLGISLLLALTLPFFINLLFDFDSSKANLLVWTTRGYLLGLTGHALLEVVARAFYARQEPKLPLIGTFIRTVLFLTASIISFKYLGVAGLATIDSATVIVEVLFLLFFLNRIIPKTIKLSDTLLRTILGCLLSLVVTFAMITFLPLPSYLALGAALVSGVSLYLLFIQKELRMIIKL